MSCSVPGRPYERGQFYKDKAGSGLGELQPSESKQRSKSREPRVLLDPTGTVDCVGGHSLPSGDFRPGCE